MCGGAPAEAAALTSRRRRQWKCRRRWRCRRRWCCKRREGGREGGCVVVGVSVRARLAARVRGAASQANHNGPAGNSRVGGRGISGGRVGGRPADTAGVRGGGMAQAGEAFGGAWLGMVHCRAWCGAWQHGRPVTSTPAAGRRAAVACSWGRHARVGGGRVGGGRGGGVVAADAHEMRRRTRQQVGRT